MVGAKCSKLEAKAGQSCLLQIAYYGLMFQNVTRIKLEWEECCLLHVS
jgi:hypothetical protein